MTFSVLIPAFKKRFLKECIDSILCQSYDDFEIVIVNDASPEDLDEVIENYSDGRIRYFKNEKNDGAVNLVNNWNRCLQYSSGKYVLCIGDDDKLAPDCLANYANHIAENPNMDVFHTRLGYINEKSEIIDLQEERPEQETALSMIWHFFLKGRRQVLGEWLFRAAPLKEQGGFFKLPCGWDSDNITAFRTAKERGVVNMRYVGFYYRMTNLSVSSQKSYAFEKVEAYNLAEQWYNLFLQDIPNNEIDTYYRNAILQSLTARMLARKLYEISIDMNNSSIFGVFKWLRRSEFAGVRKYDIIKTAYKVLKGKLTP